MSLMQLQMLGSFPGVRLKLETKLVRGTMESCLEGG